MLDLPRWVNVALPRCSGAPEVTACLRCPGRSGHCPARGQVPNGTRCTGVCLVTGDVRDFWLLIGYKFWVGYAPCGGWAIGTSWDVGAQPHKATWVQGPLPPHGHVISLPVPQPPPHKERGFASSKASSHGSLPHPVSLATPAPCLVLGCPRDTVTPFTPLPPRALPIS